MSRSKDYIEMAFQSIECFGNDGRFGAQEFGSIISLAERGNVIDQNAIRVLQKNISKIKPSCNNAWY